jgi:hypothetical protein
MQQQVLTTQQLKQYHDAIAAGGLDTAKQVYAELYAKGYDYAGWALGVATGDTITGDAALAFLQSSAMMGMGGEACVNLTPAQIDKIRLDMANGYVDTLIGIAGLNGDTLNRDVNFRDTEKFHDTAFKDNGLSLDNWTLKIPMDLLRKEFGDAVAEAAWKLMRETGGDGTDSLEASAALAAFVLAETNSSDPAVAAAAKQWLATMYKGSQLYLESLLPQLLPPPTPPGNYADPLSLDLNKDGLINTLPVTRGVHFDLDNNGFAETTSWIAPTDGLLVFDKNANGKIEGGAELFGSETKLLNGQFAQNGFEALAEYDLNADGKINNVDAIFSQLRIWQDANSNGITDAGELLTLQAANIASLNARYTSSNTIDTNNVQHRESSTYTYADGTSGLSETLWFEANKQNTIPLNGDAIVISAAIKALPDAKGFGNVYSLRQAMALDASGQLQQKVQAFVNETDIAKRKVLVNDILILWAGQQNTVAGSRGYYMDAKNDAHFARAA